MMNNLMILHAILILSFMLTACGGAQIPILGEEPEKEIPVEEEDTLEDVDKPLVDPEADPITIEGPDVITDEEFALLQSLESIRNHISGEQTLDADALAQIKTDIIDNLTIFANSTYLVQLAFDTIELYDETHGAMFTDGSA